MDKETQKQIELGRELYENGEFEKAEPVLRGIIEKNPSFADILNMLGVIYHNRGEIGRAKEFFEKAYGVNPRYTDAALNLIVAFNDLGEYDKARDIFERVKSSSGASKEEIEPYARGRLANMHADLGRVYADLGIYEDSVQQYRSALELCPTFVDLQTKMAQVMREAGKIDDAIDELNAVKAARPEYMPARLALGVAYFSRGDRASAREEWMSVLDDDPDNLAARMYQRMVDQVMAQEEAAAQGMPVEVDHLSTVPEPARDGEQELEFSLDEDGMKKFQTDASEDGGASGDEASADEASEDGGAEDGASEKGASEDGGDDASEAEKEFFKEEEE